MPGKHCEVYVGVARCSNPPIWRCEEGGFLYCEIHKQAKGAHGFRDQFGKAMPGFHYVYRKLRPRDFPNEVVA